MCANCRSRVAPFACCRALYLGCNDSSCLLSSLSRQRLCCSAYTNVQAIQLTKDKSKNHMQRRNAYLSEFLGHIIHFLGRFLGCLVHNFAGFSLICNFGVQLRQESKCSVCIYTQAKYYFIRESLQPASCP